MSGNVSRFAARSGDRLVHAVHDSKLQSLKPQAFVHPGFRLTQRNIIASCQVLQACTHQTTGLPQPGTYLHCDVVGLVPTKPAGGRPLFDQSPAVFPRGSSQALPKIWHQPGGYSCNPNEGGVADALGKVNKRNGRARRGKQEMLLRLLARIKISPAEEGDPSTKER
jgi:hypothetical protein